MLHTLVISPKYRPNKDGLSDYVYYFIKELKAQNINTNLVTSSDEQIIKFAASDSDIYPIVKSWDFFGPLKILKFVITKNPQNILVEYVPHMYGRAGVNLFFPFYVFFMRFILRKKVILMAHELHYPFEYNFKTGLLFSWHIWNLFILNISSHKVFTTTENFVKILRRFPLTKNKLHLLPVGPNIGRINPATIKDSTKNLIWFGSLHPSRMPSFIFDILFKYFKQNPESKFKLHIVGVEKDEISIDTQYLHLLENKIIFHGMLSEPQVAELFSKGHFGINFFVDGISSRRGSAIAELNLGIPIITNTADRSDAIFAKQTSVFFAELTSEGIHQVLNRIESISNEEYELLRREAMAFVDNNFSWQKTCKSYLDFVEN
jgi:glycosyltransferase involved in cell wall biosynthesis